MSNPALAAVWPGGDSRDMNTAHRLGLCACRPRPDVKARLTIGDGAPASTQGGGGTLAGPRHDTLLPDTPAARACEAYLAQVSNQTMVRHCKRTFRFGLALAKKAGAKPDLEILYVGALLHDLGLEPLFAGPEDFETLGARAAETFLEAQGYARMSRQVAAAIEVHTNPATADDHRPEVAYLCMGALCDVVGARLDHLDPRLIQQVVEDYPRDGTKALITALLKLQIDTKPLSRIGVAQARLNVVQRIWDAPFTG